MLDAKGVLAFDVGTFVVEDFEDNGSSSEQFFQRKLATEPSYEGYNALHDGVSFL